MAAIAAIRSPFQLQTEETMTTDRTDIHTRLTASIIAELRAPIASSR
jgi:hypothetical protein